MVWNQLRMYLQKSTPTLAIDMHIFEIIILKKSTIGMANVRSVYNFSQFLWQMRRKTPDS